MLLEHTYVPRGARFDRPVRGLPAPRQIDHAVDDDLIARTATIVGGALREPGRTGRGDDV